MNTIQFDDVSADALAAICAAHLREEERLLCAAVPMARAVKEAFMQPRIDSLVESLQRNHEVTRLLDELRQRRRLLRREVFNRILPDAAEHTKLTLTQIVGLLPAKTQDSLLSQLAFVRQLAEELVRLNHWLAVHTRIHLEAYERMLRDLVGSASHSGRYGPQGKTETPEYRPLLEIHG